MRTGGALRSARSAWHSVAGGGPDFTHQGPDPRWAPEALEGYWCDLRHKARRAAEFADGVPRDGAGRRIDWVIPVAQAALGAWQLRADGDPGAEDQFLALARRLRAGGERRGAGLAWPIAVPVEKYALRPGWVSAMGQGEVVSVFLRAQALTSDIAWRDAARAAFAPLKVPVAEGGVQREWQGALVLEEYPTPEPTAVLNGWIFALAGAWELGDDGRDVFHRSVDGLLTLLSRYDVGWWSLYSLRSHGARPDLAKPFYQRLHPVLLDALGRVVDDPRLPATAARWRAQLTTVSVARAAGDKLAFRLLR